MPGSGAGGPAEMRTPSSYLRLRREARAGVAREIPGPEKRPVDLHLIGAAYSGSTHLGGLLAANLDAVYAGEVAHLPKYVEDHRLYDQPIGCLICAAEDRPCPVWTPELSRSSEQAGPAGSSNPLRSQTGAAVVVDGSKWPAWLGLANAGRDPSGAGLAAVVVARSPFRYAVSATAATRSPTWMVAQWWRDVYADALRTVARQTVPAVVVRNEDLRRDALPAVRAIASLVGQDPPQHLEAATPTHSLGGNIWVQHGYSEQTYWLQHKMALREGLEDDGPLDDAAWARIAGQASTTVVNRPRTRGESVDFVQQVLDCPGLGDVAQYLGYELGREADAFISEAPSP